MNLNKERLHRSAVSYIEHFLDDVKHIRNRVLVKTVIARMEYGSIIKVKIYRYISGNWERYSKHISRVKCGTDLTILHSTLNHYVTILQYMYNNDSDSDSESDN